MLRRKVINHISEVLCLTKRSCHRLSSACLLVRRAAFLQLAAIKGPGASVVAVYIVTDLGVACTPGCLCREYVQVLMSKLRSCRNDIGCAVSFYPSLIVTATIPRYMSSSELTTSEVPIVMEVRGRNRFNHSQTYPLPSQLQLLVVVTPARPFPPDAHHAGTRRASHTVRDHFGRVLAARLALHGVGRPRPGQHGPTAPTDLRR